MKGLTLTQKEQARLQVLNGILEGQISVDEAAEVLGVSERHVWRILAEYRKEGAAALAHGNRGRRANNSIPEEARTQVVALARTRYARVNHTHLTELLAEREEIVLGRSTVRRILVGAGMASPRRRRPPLHRVRRQRMSQEGMLVQVDGSVHAWLEERGPRCTLLLAIDDATSTVPYALFRHEEDTHGYFLLMQELIRRCGVPLALYSDRHAVFKYVPGSHQSPAPTQFGRAMAELGVEQIFARSPEAKGRVERANGTFQDRLVTELRPPERVEVHFAGTTCEPCPLRSRCPVKLDRRAGAYVLKADLVKVNIERRRRAEATEEWRKRYEIRAGIEGTNSELKRAHGLGRLRVRVRGGRRVRLAVYLKALACNFKRMVHARLVEMENTAQRAVGTVPAVAAA